MKVNFDDLDRELYKELQKTGKVVVERLAKKHNASKTDILFSFVKMEKAGLCTIDKVKTEKYQYFKVRQGER